jgi:hypothetical protein
VRLVGSNVIFRIAKDIIGPILLVVFDSSKQSNNAILLQGG